MAQSKKEGKVGKITFGTRKLGSHKKRTGPKESPKSEYRGQGKSR